MVYLIIRCDCLVLQIRDVGSLSECQHPLCAQKSHERKVIRMCGANKQPPFIAATNTIQVGVSVNSFVELEVSDSRSILNSS